MFSEHCTHGCLGTKVYAPDFQDAVMTGILLYWSPFGEPINPEFVAWAIENLERTSLLFKAINDQLVHDLTTNNEAVYRGNGKYRGAFDELLTKHQDLGHSLIWMVKHSVLSKNLLPPFSNIQKYYVETSRKQNGSRTGCVRSKANR